MTTTRHIAQNSLIQIIGKIISTALGLVAIGMMTRTLGTEGFGWYTSAIGLLQFIGIMTDFGMTPVTVRLLSEAKPEEEQTLFQNILGFRLVTAILCFGITPIIAYIAGYQPIIVQAVTILAIGFVGIALNQVFLGLYQTKLRLVIHSLGEIFGRIALVIGILFITLRGAAFLPMMWAVTIAAIVFTLILWMNAERTLSSTLRFDLTVWKRIISLGWPISMAIIFNVVYLKGDVIILNWFVSQGEIGLYGAAYRVLDVLTQAAMMLMGIFLPLLSYNWSRKLQQTFNTYYQQAFDTLLLFAIPMTVGGYLLATPLITLVAGEEFIASGQVLAILTIAVFGVYIGAIFGHTAVAIDRQREAMWIYLSNAIITLTGYLLVIPVYGIIGAAWMTVASELYAGIALFLLVRHYAKTRLQFIRVGKALAASLIMGIIITQLIQLPVLLVIGIGTFVYTILLIGFRAVSRSFVFSLITKKPLT